MEHRIQLENFAGPLDLLLYLVQKEEVDIREVSLIRICDQYLSFLDELKERDIEQAGDFFVLAASLMAIKARSLLPQEEVDLDEELDPEEELIQQLLEYRKIKEVSRHLGNRAASRTLIHPSRPEVSDAGIPLDEVDLYDLVDAFRKMLRETGLDHLNEGIIESERPLSLYVTDLLAKLKTHRKMSFFQVFEGSNSRTDLIGFFLALLELIKAQIVKARQEGRFGEISIEAQGEVPTSLTSEDQPLTSENSAAAAASGS